MPFARPSLSDLITRIRGDIRGRVSVDGPPLRRAMIDVIGAVVAGAVHTAYGLLDWLAKQLFGDTADADMLQRMAAIWGIFLVAGTYASGSATATGPVGSIGLVIPVGSKLKLDSATEYTTTANATMVLDVVTGRAKATLAIQAVLAGSASNVDGASSLSFETPQAGVDPTATVDADITNGVDQETVDSLRARFLLRLREPPEGGADQDYEAWALDVAGVTRAWVYPNENGLGTVVVRFVRDGDVGGIFPDGGEVAAVQASLTNERPITAAVTAVAPTNLAVNFTVHITPNTTDAQAAVSAELADLMMRVAAPGNAGGTLGKVLLSQIQTAIGTAEGVTDFVLTVPSADVVPGVGQLPTVGTVTFV